jgi:hypothetical protein
LDNTLLILLQVKHQEDERLTADLEAKKAHAAEVLQAQLAHAVRLSDHFL